MNTFQEIKNKLTALQTDNKFKTVVAQICDGELFFTVSGKEVLATTTTIQAVVIESEGLIITALELDDFCFDDDDRQIEISLTHEEIQKIINEEEIMIAYDKVINEEEIFAVVSTENNISNIASPTTNKEYAEKKSITSRQHPNTEVIKLKQNNIFVYYIINDKIYYSHRRFVKEHPRKKLKKGKLYLFDFSITGVKSNMEKIKKGKDDFITIKN